MKIFGITLTKTSKNILLKKILKLKNRTIVFTPNPEMLLKAKDDNSFKKILKKADYLLSDGIGLFIAYQILDSRGNNKIIQILKLPIYVYNLFFKREYLYKRFGDRICGSDLTKDLLENFNKKKETITIIDLYNPNDKNKVKNQKVFKEKLKKFFNNLKIDYYIYDENKKDKIIEKIKKSDSKILFSTLGIQKQEESIVEIMEKCKNIKLGLGVGSSFDYFTGLQKRAPKIVKKIGFEWLYRLFTGPQKLKRLARLYNAIFVFIREVIKDKQKD